MTAAGLTTSHSPACAGLWRCAATRLAKCPGQSKQRWMVPVRTFSAAPVASVSCRLDQAGWNRVSAMTITQWRVPEMAPESRPPACIGLYRGRRDSPAWGAIRRCTTIHRPVGPVCSPGSDSRLSGVLARLPERRVSFGAGRRMAHRISYRVPPSCLRAPKRHRRLGKLRESAARLVLMNPGCPRRREPTAIASHSPSSSSFRCRLGRARRRSHIRPWRCHCIREHSHNATCQSGAMSL